MRSLIVIALIAIVCPTVVQAQTGDVAVNSFGVLAASGGRYVLGQISPFRRDQFLLDTHTGRVLATANVGTKDDPKIVFVPMPFLIESPEAGFRFAPPESPQPKK